MDQPAAKYRYIGVTDECVVCQRCGKPNLKSTVMLAYLDADGNDEEATYYGSTCAARALNVTGRGASAKVLGLARAAHRQMVGNAYDARQMLGLYGLPETGNPTGPQLTAAIAQYRHTHRLATWARTTDYNGWLRRTTAMLTRYQGVLAEAARLKVTIPPTTRDLATYLASI